MKEKYVILPNNLPYYNSAVFYAKRHRNLFLTPAHVFMALLADDKARTVIRSACEVSAAELFGLSQLLSGYCEVMELEYLTDDVIDEHLTASVELLDFASSFNDELYSKKRLSVASFFTSLHKASPEITDMVEAVFRLTVRQVVKNIEKKELTSDVLDISMDDYIEYAKKVDFYNSYNGTTLGGLYDCLDDKDRWDSEQLEKIDKRFSSSCFVNRRLQQVGVAEKFYSEYIEDDTNKKVTVSIKGHELFVPGYEELITLLTTLGKENQFNTLVGKFVSHIEVTETGSVTWDTLDTKTDEQMVSTVANVEEVYMCGNDKLLEVAKEILVRKDKPYLLVLGDGGTGKTTFVKKLADMAVKGELSNDITYSPYFIDIAAMMGNRGLNSPDKLFKDLVKKKINLAKSEGKQAFFIIEDIDMSVNTSMVVSDSPELYKAILEFMNTEKVPLIGTTCYSDYRRTIAKVTRFDSKFTVVRLEEVSREDMLTILEHSGEEVVESYGLTVDKDIYSRIYDLSKQFIRDKQFPDKALTLLNQASAYAYTHGITYLTSECVEKVMERDYAVPSARLNTNLAESIDSVKKEVESKLFGQPEAIDTLMKYWKIKQAGLTKENKPIASLLFVGPTGVGKTELAKKFADSIGYNLVRLDMSEYMESHSVSKLIGSPPGYVGYDEGGVLITAIRSKPNCVLLLDEIEKAHPKVNNILLQIMDSAELTGSTDEKADFQNVVLLMTSNCGASDAANANALGFFNGSQKEVAEKLRRDIVDKSLNSTFTPEFRGRLSSIVHFNSLTKDMAESITRYKLDELKKLILKTRKNLNICITDSLINYIVNKALEGTSGGRCIEVAVDGEVKDKMLDILLTLPATTDKTLTLDCVNNEVLVTI